MLRSFVKPPNVGVVVDVVDLSRCMEGGAFIGVENAKAPQTPPVEKET